MLTKSLCFLLVLCTIALRADAPGNAGKAPLYRGTVKILDQTARGDKTALQTALMLHLEHPQLDFEIRRKSGPGFDPDITLYEGRPKPGDLLYAARRVYVTVHSSNPLQDITPDQLRGICTGKIAEWTALNQSPFSIHRYALALRSGPDAVKAILGNEKAASFYRAGNANELYLLLGGNRYSIGVCTEPPGNAKQVKILSVAGKHPEADDYPLVLPRSLSIHHPGALPKLFYTVLAERSKPARKN